MIDVRNEKIPNLDNNNPSYINKEGYTVAMIFAEKKKLPPKEWKHDSLI